MAGPAATIQMAGLAETQKALQQLPTKIQKRCMSKAVRAGGAVFVKAAKRNAPQLTGLFKRSLDQRVKTYQDGKIAVSVTGQKSVIKNRRKLRRGRGGLSGRGYVVPIHLIENVIRPHRIPKEFRKTQVATSREWRLSQRAKGLRDRKYIISRRGPLMLRLPSGQIVMVDHIDHPGVSRGRNVLRKVADASANAAVNAFALKSREEIDRIVDSTRAAMAATFKYLETGSYE